MKRGDSASDRTFVSAADADDGIAVGRAAADHERATDSLRRRSIDAARQLGAHDRDLFSAFAVNRRERAPGHERNSHDAEILVRHTGEVGDHPVARFACRPECHRRIADAERWPRRECHGAHARLREQRRAPLVEQMPSGVRSIVAHLKIGRGDAHVPNREPRIDVERRAERPSDERRVDEQEQRERELRHDHDVPCARPARRRAALGLEHRHHAEAGAAQRRQKREEHADDQRHREREDDHARVHPNVQVERHFDRRFERGDGMRRDTRDPDRHGASAEEQHHRFGDELPHDRGAAGAERDPHGQLSLALHSARHDHAGQVAAGYEQDQQGEAHEER